MTARRERQLGWVTQNVQRFPLEQAEDWLAAVAACLCPFCGSGPFTVLALHVNLAHGYDRYEFREMLGLPSSASVCDPTHSAATAERLRGRPDNVRRLTDGVTSDARHSAAASRAEYHKRRTAQRDQAIEAEYRCGDLMKVIAERHGLNAVTVRVILRQRGVLADGRSGNAAAIRVFPDAGRAAAREKASTHREDLLSFLAAGGTVEDLAKREGVTNLRSYRSYLRKLGAVIPDQRTTKSREMVSFVCPVCSKPATKYAGTVRANRKQGWAGPFCGLSCAAKYRMAQRV